MFCQNCRLLKNAMYKPFWDPSPICSCESDQKKIDRYEEDLKRFKEKMEDVKSWEIVSLKRKNIELEAEVELLRKDNERFKKIHCDGTVEYTPKDIRARDYHAKLTIYGLNKEVSSQEIINWLKNETTFLKGRNGKISELEYSSKFMR